MVGTPFIEAHNISVYAQYTIQIENRDRVRAALHAAGIPTAVHYPTPLHRQPALAQDCRLPASEHAAKRVLSLPMHPYLTDRDMDDVIRAIGSAVTSV